MKKIFYKKDYDDILLFLNEEGQATLNNNYKGCKIVLDSQFQSAWRILIYDSLNVEYDEFLVANYRDSYEHLHTAVATAFSIFESKYIQGQAKSLEEVMSERKAEADKKALEEENNNFNALEKYIQTGDENFYCNCLTYYENNKNLAHAVDVLITNEIESAATSNLRIAFFLRVAYDKELYKVSGFKNIYDYANDKFYLARGTVSDYINMVQNFGILNEETGFYTLDDRLKKYSLTQLVCMKKLSIEQIEKNNITPDTSTREIRQIVKDLQNISNIAVSADIDFSDNIPENPDDESELYKDLDIDDCIPSPSSSDDSEGSSDNQAYSTKLNLIFTGGSTLSKTQIEFLNKFLSSQPAGKELHLVFQG